MISPADLSTETLAVAYSDSSGARIVLAGATSFIQDEVLQITTLEADYANPNIRVYPVLDLLSEVRAEDELELNPAVFGNHCPITQRGIAYPGKGRLLREQLDPTRTAVSVMDQVDTFATDDLTVTAVITAAVGSFSDKDQLSRRSLRRRHT